MSFVLVIYIYASFYSAPIAIHSVPMKTLEVCQREGMKGQNLVSGSTKEYRFVCLKVD